MKELDTLLNTLADVVKPIVEHIEGQVPTTKGHYGDYMVAIDRVAGQLGVDAHSKSLYIAIGVALQRAGADKFGVQSALRTMGHL